MPAHQIVAWNLGWISLAIAWLGPLPFWAQGSFAAHMTLHMLVVGVAAPCLAIGLAGRRWDPVRSCPKLFSPVVASVGELLIVWAWHAPRLHHYARFEATGFVLEQAAFLAAGLWIWLAAFGGVRRDLRRRAAGIAALLLTSMHMTFLGALLALSPRALFSHGLNFSGLNRLQDQHLGGAIMLLVGGLSFLLGGLALTVQLVRQRRSPPLRAPTKHPSDSKRSTEMA